MGEKRDLLKQLRKSIRSENAFNVQRRIFRHHKQYTQLFQSEARLKGFVTIPEAIAWQQSCPACHYHKMKLYEIGNFKNGRRVNNDIAVWCERCDLELTGIEYAAIRPNKSLSLKSIYEKIKPSLSE